MASSFYNPAPVGATSNPNSAAIAQRRRFLQNNGLIGANDTQYGPAKPAVYGPSLPVTGPSSQENMSVGQPKPVATPTPRQAFIGPTLPQPSVQKPVVAPTQTPVTTAIKPTPTQPPAGLTGAARQRFIEQEAGITSPNIPAKAPVQTAPAFSIQGSRTQPVRSIQTPTPQETALSVAEKARNDARSRFLSALNPDQGLTDLQRSLADYRTATATGVAGEEGQGRGKTASLVRGRQEKLLTQRSLGEQNLLAQIDITQNVVNQNQQRALQELGFAKEDLDAIRADVLAQGKAAFGEVKEFGDQLLRIAPDGSISVLANKQTNAEPVTLSEGQILIDPTTGKQIAINQKDRAPITLSAGQTVIDPNTGEVLYQTASKPEPMPTSIQEYLFATQQGFTGSFQDYQRQAGTGGTLSAEASKLVANAKSGISSIQTMLQTVDNNFGRGILGSLTNREYKAAEANLVDVIGRLRSGGAITDTEVANFKQLLPSWIDSDELARKKLQDVQTLLNDALTGVQGSGGSSQNDPLGILGGGSGNDPLGFSNDLSTSQNGFDNNVERIAASIRQVESGGNYNAKGASTEGGAYQFMPSTWKQWASQYLGDPNAPMTPQNQDFIAKSKIKELVDQGKTPYEIALIWNGGQPLAKRGVNRFGVAYDSGAYADKVTGVYNSLG